MKPEISVIIPVHNGEKTLSKSLNSVLNQTIEDYEVIVVDNNSSDKTKEIIKDLEKKYLKVKYVFEEYQSRGAARNAGINHAKGKIIAMTDADCIVEDSWLKDLTKPIVLGYEQAVMGKIYSEPKNFWSKFMYYVDLEQIKKSRRQNYINTIYTGNFAICTELLKQLMFDQNIKNLDDFEFFLRLRALASIRLLQHVKVTHQYDNNFLSVVKNRFDKGYWYTKIFFKHKNNTKIYNEMKQSISLFNWVEFIVDQPLNLIKSGIRKTFFDIVSGISWRLGILSSRYKDISLIEELAEKNSAMMDINLYQKLKELLSDTINKKIQGDVVEIGCFKGYTSILIQDTLLSLNAGKKLHVYDSFQGLPERSDHDLNVDLNENDLKCSPQELINNFEYYNLKTPVMHVGWFNDSLVNELPEKISFAHLDGDFYSSIKDSLNFIYPKLSSGSCVVIDDYYPDNDHFSGVKKACDEFFVDKPEELTIIYSGKEPHAYFFKK